MKIQFRHNRRSSVIPWTATWNNHHSPGETQTEAVVGLLCAAIFGYVP